MSDVGTANDSQRAHEFRRQVVKLSSSFDPEQDMN